MRNLVCIVVMIFTSQHLQGQNANALSIGGLYSDLTGLNVELSYDNFSTKRIGFTGRIAHNSKKSFGIRSGLYYRLLDSKSFDLDFGLEFSFEQHNSDILDDKISSTNIEFPTTLNYSINSRYGVFAGASSSVNLNDTESNRIIDNVRLGVKYRW